MDVNGTVIATNRTVCTISVIHNQVKDPETVIRVLVDELGVPEEEVRKKVEKRSSREIIKTNVDKEEGDKILQDLKKVARYTGLDGCRMRCGFHFDYKGMELTYHKTLPYSTIVETDPVSGVTYDILYDILIKQNGDIHSDWDGTPLDVDAYEKVVFEPYDLRWLARIA